MLLLTTLSNNQLIEERHPCLGRLAMPRHCGDVALTHSLGFPWAADNDAFGGFGEAESRRYVSMLDAIAGVPGCLFVCVPDVVGDARATATMFATWRQSLVERDLPLALVAQDGIEELGIPWDKIAALFIGGTTEFKLGRVAEDLADEAKARGKWVHMGRVNSRRRIHYAASIGCDSVDGSSFAQFRTKWLQRGCEWAAEAKRDRPGRQFRLV